MNQLEQKLEQDFGIVFSQKELLETAFTHTSYANEHRLLNISHNERLEFLGDAALQLVISVLLPISIQISILKLGEPNHVREVFLRFVLSSKRHL